MTAEELLEEQRRYSFLRFVADTLTAARFVCVAFLATLLVFRWDHAASDARRARGMAAGADG